VSICPSCQAHLAPGATWCSQCYAAVAPATRAAESGTTRFAPQTAAAVPLGPPTRWRKTPTTFGPAGRLLATVALLVPLAFMVVGGMVFTAAWAGALIWLVLVMPRALRDIWRAGRVPA
jgi:hypothetical protein